MILIGLGANLPSDRFGAPKATLEAALGELESRGARVVQCSRWYSSAPVPPSGQPRYINAVAAIETDLAPEALLALLHAIEAEFGRQRGEINAARVIDLDLLVYGDLVRADSPPILPHPRLGERAFVLLPLCDIAPHWQHPETGLSARDMAAAAIPGSDVAPLPDPD